MSDAATCKPGPSCPKSCSSIPKWYEGVTYLGVCCGAGPHHICSLAEALGRTPPASRYSADMSKHSFLGTDPRLKQEYRDYAPHL